MDRRAAPMSRGVHCVVATPARRGLPSFGSTHILGLGRELIRSTGWTSRQDGVVSLAGSAERRSPRRWCATSSVGAFHELHERLAAIEGVLDPEVVPVVALELVGVLPLRLGRGDTERERVPVPGATRG